MRLFISAMLACAAFTAACTGNTATVPNSNGQGSRARADNRPTGTGTSSNASTAGSGVIPSHGTAPSAPAAAVSEKDRSLLDTAALDAKIASALPKAKAPDASAADKSAAAAAYLARGNAYRDAGNPSLYRFALADFNSVLIYDPSNAEAKAKRDELIRIYREMGRAIPQVSNEK